MPETPSSPIEKPKTPDVSLDARFAGKSPNEILRTIPDAIPGAASVNKIEVPGAKHVLVHVRQLHPATDTNPTYEQIEMRDPDVRAVQTDIHLILLKLKSSAGMRRIYLEGATKSLTAKSFVDYHGVFMNRRSALQKLRATSEDVLKAQQGFRESAGNGAEDDVFGRTLKSAAGTASDQMDLLYYDTQSAEAELEKKLEKTDQAQSQFMAAGELARSSKIEIAAAETKQANAAAMELFRNKKKSGEPLSSEYNAVTLDARENVLLDIVSANKDPFAVTVYGGGHDWSDNIKQWNDKNPNDKFSLVVITPKSYPKD